MMNGQTNGTQPANGQQPAMAVDGRAEAAVTLQINTWNVILSVIAKAPWETADPLIQEIRRQVAASLDSSTAAAGERPAQPVA